MALLEWFLKTKLWVWLATNVFALFTVRILGYPKFKMENFFKMAKAIKDSGEGVYAIVGADTKVGSFVLEYIMTKAFYSHVGLVYVKDVNDLSTYKFLHITSQGMSYDHILDYLREVDRAAIVKLPVSLNLTPYVYKDMDEYIKDESQYEYDFNFDLLGPNKKLYCSELVYKIVSSYTNKLITSEEGGRRVVTPDNIFQSGEIIYQEN